MKLFFSFTLTNSIVDVYLEKETIQPIFKNDFLNQIYIFEKMEEVNVYDELEDGQMINFVESDVFIFEIINKRRFFIPMKNILFVSKELEAKEIRIYIKNGKRFRIEMSSLESINQMYTFIEIEYLKYVKK